MKCQNLNVLISHPINVFYAKCLSFYLSVHKDNYLFVYINGTIGEMFLQFHIFGRYA